MAERLTPVVVSTTVDIRPGDIHVRRGSFTTVWLGEFSDPGGRTQVELAVLDDGTRRICVPAGAPVKVLTFEEVYG